MRSLRITDDQLIRLFRDHDDYQFELSAKGELIIMPPATPKSDERNVTITTRLRVWTEQDGTGRSFGPTAMFTLPNGAKRCPMRLGFQTAVGIGLQRRSRTVFSKEFRNSRQRSL